MNGAAGGRFLEGRHAIVTGGATGIGWAIAQSLAGAGARVTIVSRNEQTLATRVAELRAAGAEAAFESCDVTQALDVDAACGRAVERFGVPYVLVCNAGMAKSEPLPAHDVVLWENTLATNLSGTFHWMSNVTPLMMGPKQGRIVNIASTAGVKGFARLAAYSAAKHGVVGLTRAAAAELRKSGITVNAVCPGYVDTAMSQHGVDELMQAKGLTREEALARIAASNPGGRLIAPGEVAETVLWLCTDAAAAISGQAIVVAGGEVA